MNRIKIYRIKQELMKYIIVSKAWEIYKRVVGRKNIYNVLDVVSIPLNTKSEISAELEYADKVIMNWPTVVDKPYVGVVKESLLPTSYWDKYERFLINNKIPYEFYDIHKCDFMNQAEKFDIILWRTLSDPATQMEAQSKIWLLEQHMNKKCLPSYGELWFYEDKVNQYYLGKLHKLPMIETFISYSLQDANNFIKNTNYPFVSKIKTGSASQGVELVKSYKQASKIISKVFKQGRKTYPPHLYLKQKNYVYFQEFIPDAKFDLRIIVVGNNYFGYYRKVAENDFRASGGGLESYGSIKQEVLFLAKKVKEKFPKTRALAIDMLKNEIGQYQVIETSIFYRHDFPSETIVDGILGRYVYDGECFEFKKGKFWIQELTLLELMHEWIKEKS